MQRSASKRPSPALVLSMITLFVALTSTAGALPGRHSIDSGDLEKGAVTSRALAKGAVKARAIAPRAVTSGKLANHAVVENKLARFSVGAFALGDTATISAPISDNDLLPGPGNTVWTTSQTVEAVCPSGTTLLGGGVSISDGSTSHEAAVQTSAPSTDRWLGAIATNAGGAAPGRVYAICLL
jgi:hypothetical protein